MGKIRNTRMIPLPLTVKGEEVEMSPLGSHISKVALTAALLSRDTKKDQYVRSSTQGVSPPPVAQCGMQKCLDVDKRTFK